MTEKMDGTSSEAPQGEDTAMSPTTQLQNASRRGVRFAIRSEGAGDAGWASAGSSTVNSGDWAALAAGDWGLVSKRLPNGGRRSQRSGANTRIENQRGRDRHHMGESIASGNGLVNWQPRRRSRRSGRRSGWHRVVGGR